jgi:hypothetical protein
MKKVWPLLLVILLGLSACSTNNADDVPNRPGQDRENNSQASQEERTYDEFSLDLGSGPANLNRLKMSLANLEGFSAVFTLSFDGSKDWLYQVETRYDGELIEYNLHIEGVDTTQNPGDLRLVNTSGTNRMIGPGTDNTCVQFPDQMRTGVLFLSPVDVINPDVLIDNWTIEEGQTYLNREVAFYNTGQDYYYGWEDIEVSFILDSATGAILGYVFDAAGGDPLYGYGGGEIHGEFTVVEIGPQEIEPVEGCEFPFPLPDDAYDIIILPGVFSYQSSLGPVRTDRHFGQVLPPLGWSRDTAQINDEVREGFLIYISDTHTLTIHIQALNPEDFSEGYLIRLYIEDN